MTPSPVFAEESQSGYSYSPAFNATGSNFYDISDNPSLRLPQFTAAAWFKTTSSYTPASPIVNKGGFGNPNTEASGQNMNYGIWMYGSQIEAGFETSTGANKFVKTTQSYNDGNWHYAVVTYDGTIVRLYIDGVQVGTNSQSLGPPDTNGDQPLRIGANSLSSGTTDRYFVGEIDEVRVWNRAITAQEVADQYNTGDVNATLQLLYFDGVENNYLPVANAGADQTVDEGTLVTLDGTASSDPDGDPLVYSWNQTAGTPVDLSDPTSVTPTFTAPEVGFGGEALTFELTVGDDRDGMSIDTVSITINDTSPPPPNSPPIANAGLDQSVNEAVVVTLDGSASSDNDGTIQSYSWNQTGGPTVALSDPSSVMPMFTAPNVGATGAILSFELQVTDNGGNTNTDTVDIYVVNQPGYSYSPTFSSTWNEFYEVTDTSSLHPSSFSLAAWFKTSRNYFSNGVIANKGGFGSDAPGSNLNYGLWMDSNEKIRGGFETSPGADIVVTSPNAYSDGLWHYAVVTYDGSIVRLYVDGNPVGSRTSTVGPDIDGTQPFRIGANSQANDSRFIGSIDEVRLWSRAITAQEVADQYNTGDVNATLQLLYFDGVENNYLPVANAGTDQTTAEGTLVTLNGTGSFDPDGTIVSYQWQQTGGMPVVTLNGSGSAVAIFDAPQLDDNAILTFRLTVTDEDGESGVDDISVTILNNNTSPTASAGDDQTTAEGTLVTLNGTGSFDPDGTIVSYLWEHVTNGTFQTFALNGSDSAIATFETPDVTSNTILTFRLTVSDNNGGTASDEVSVNVLRVNQPPVANAGANQTVLETSVVMLNGTASYDPDGDQIAYFWTQTGGTPITLSNSTSPAPTFTAPSVGLSPITLSFQLSVTDPENASSTASVDIVVTHDNAAPVAEAGPDQTKNEGTSVALTGTGNDPDGWPQPLSYQWEQIDTSGYRVDLTPVTPSGSGNLAINKVQSGTLTLGTNPTNIAITSVDMSKAFAMCYSGTTSSNANNVVTCNLTSPTNLRIEAGVASSAINVAWYVVEFAEGAFVQRGETSWTSGTSSQNIAISSVDLTKSFVLISTRTTSTSQVIDEQRMTRAALTSPTNLQLSRAETGIAVTHVWQIIQLEDTVVQSGTTTLSGVSSATASISAVDLAETFLVFSTSGSTSTNGVDAQYYIRGRLTSSTQITFDRNSSTNSATVSWFAVSVDRSIVQSGMNSAANTETIFNNAISAVDLTRTSAFASATVGSSATADQDSGSWVPSFTSATNLRVQRQSSQNVPSNIAWFAVEWPLAAPPVTEGGSSVIFTTPEIPSGSVVLTFRLIASDGDKSDDDTINVTVNNLATSGYNYPASFVATGSSSVSVQDNPTLRLTKYSVAAWFKTSSNFGGDVFIVNKGGFGGTTSGNNLNYGIWMDSNERINVGFETAGNTRYVAQSDNSYNNGQWHYVVMTYDPNPVGQSSRVYLYIDGVFVDRSSNTNNNFPDINGAYPVKIGANSQASDRFFIGEIDEVRLWNRVLSESEIASQYNSGTIDASGQILYFNGLVANQNPTANAGLDKKVDENTMVTLNGAASSDPDGNQLSYYWNQTAGPSVSLNGAYSVSPKFTAPIVGSTDQVLTFVLTVGDGLGQTSTDTMNVIVQGPNLPPVADAGPDQTVDEGVQVTLNGTGSDPDNNSLTYMWTQIGGPSLLIEEPDSQNLVFVAPIVAKNITVTFEFLVSDGRANSTDTVTVVIVNTAGGYLYSPAFIAKGNNYYTIPDHPSLHLQTFSLAVWFRTSQVLTTDGMIANKGGFGSDVPGENMNYGIWMTKTGTIKSGFELLDGTDYWINSPNIAYNDGEWHYVVLTYDGSKVTQFIDGAQAGWRPITSSPDNTGDQPLRMGANSQSNSRYFKGEIDEVRVWNRAVTSLEVSDQYNSGIFLLDGQLLLMDGVMHDNTPVAIAGSDLTVNEDTMALLNGSASFDPDGTALTYVWSQVSGPAVTLADPTAVVQSFTAPIVASDTSLEFALTVSDGTLNNTDTVVFTIINTAGGYQFAPGYDLQGSQYIEIPDSAALRLSTYTATAWFRTDANFTSDAFVVNKGGLGFSSSAGNNLNYGIWLDVNEKVKGGFETTSGFDVFVTSPDSYADGYWHFVVLTCDCPTSGSSTLKLYIDGQVVATKTVANKPDKSGTFPVRIGAHGEDYSAYFAGEIDEVRIWDRLLEQAEISDQYLSSIFNTAGEVAHVDMADVPKVEAGELQLVAENSPAILSNAGTLDPDNDVLTYVWSQISGPTANITNSGIGIANITTPDVSGEETLYFLLKATDDAYSATDRVRIVVYEPGLTGHVLDTPDFMDDLEISVENAQDYFYASEYYFRPYDSTLFNNLQDAIDRGVDVKVTISSQQFESSPTIEQDLQQRGIPYRIVDAHTKTVVIDDEVAYVGSANLNINGLERNWELTLKTTNPDTIKEAKEYVLSMFETGIKKKDLTDYYYERFANGPEYVNLVIDAIENANSIKILQFEMTYNFKNPNAPDTLALNALRDAKLRGANLQILLDDGRYGVRYGGEQFLSQNNIPHKVDDRPPGTLLSLMHAKTMLIDDSILFIGSQNWNGESIGSVGETSVVTRNPQAIAEYQAIFNVKWNQGIWVIAP